MVHPSSRFYRYILKNPLWIPYLCCFLIASMLFQAGCFSTRKTKYTHNPSDPKPAELESGVWYLEMELRDESVIKVTPANSEFGEVLYLKAQDFMAPSANFIGKTPNVGR